jgi:predicted DNA-binding protein (MmcQ/YjbR family)
MIDHSHELVVSRLPRAVRARLSRPGWRPTGGI